jgi:hypothetical protein
LEAELAERPKDPEPDLEQLRTALWEAAKHFKVHE